MLGEEEEKKKQLIKIRTREREGEFSRLKNLGIKKLILFFFILFKLFFLNKSN